MGTQLRSAPLVMSHVNVNGAGYQCATRYMIRLQRRDFEDPARLAPLAREVNMTPEQFTDRFGYLVYGR